MSAFRLLFAGLLASCLAAADLRVTPAGIGTGSSWSDAAGLSAALAVARPGDALWIAAGTYVPGNARTATFGVPAGVALYGGFTGTETALVQRRDDPGLVVLSGEIGNPALTTDNIQVIVTLNGSGTRLDTLTITKAFGVSVGTAIFSSVTGSQIALHRCVVAGNAGYGGCVVWLSSCHAATVSRCVVRDNLSSTAANSTVATLTVNRDAAVDSAATMNFSDLVIADNQCSGLFIGFSSNAAAWTDATVENAVITGNQGPGINADRGLFSVFAYGSLTVQASTIIGNVGESIFMIGSQLQARNLIVDGALAAISPTATRLSESVWSTGVDGDPRFIAPGDPAGPDGLWGTGDDGYRLRADSPLIDWGRMITATTGRAAPARDLLGTPRPRNRDPDPGAYEFDSGNSAPLAAMVTVAAIEDSLTPLTLGGSDVDGDVLTGVIETLPVEGLVYPTADGVSASGPALAPGDLPYTCPLGQRVVLYHPAADVNGPARTSFTFALRDASLLSYPATCTCDVLAVNDAPTAAAPGDQTVAEDSGSHGVTLSGLGAGGGEVQGLSVTAVSSDRTILQDPAVSYLSPAATAQLTFAPLPNRFGSVTVTVVVHDDGGTARGGVDTTTVTFRITVQPVNDPPTFAALADRHLPEDSIAMADLHVVVGSVLPGPFEDGQALNVVVTSADQTRLRIGTVDASRLASDGSAAFDLQPQPDASGSVLVYVTVFDDGGSALGGTNNATRLFTVTLDPVNDLPLLVSNTGIAVAALGTAPVGPGILRCADADAPPTASLVFTLATAPVWGGLRRDDTDLVAGATFTQAEIDAGRISYEHRIFGSAADALDITWSDGVGVAQGPATVAIQVIGTIRPLVVLPSPGPAWSEGGGPVQLAATATVSDPDSPDLDGGRISITVLGGESADRIVILDQGAGADRVTVAGTTVRVGGLAVGVVSGGDGTPLVVSLAGTDATPAAVQAIVRALAFDHGGRNPGATARTVQVVVGDGDVGDSVPVTTTVQVVPRDDPPRITTTVLGCVAGSAREAVLTADDPDSPQLTWSVAVPADHTTVTLLDAVTGRLRIAATARGSDSITMTVSDGVNPPQSAVITIVISGADDPRPHPAADPPPEAFAGETWHVRLPFDLVELGGTGDLEFAPLGEAPAGLVLTATDARTVEVSWAVPVGEVPGHRRFAILAADRVTGAAGQLPVLLLVRAPPSANQ